jgi:predicted Zn finger-like uncharacterized protein
MSHASLVACPQCAVKIRVRAQQVLGKKVRCPKCSKVFVATRALLAGDNDRAEKPSNANVDASSAAAESVDDEYGPAVAPLILVRPKREGADAEPDEEESPKKKRRKRDRPPAAGLPWIMWPIFGGAAGGIAGAMWIAVTFFTGYEFGIVAIVVGLATGIGVQMAAGAETGSGPGETAAGTAIVVILLSKFVVVCLVLEKFVGMNFFSVLNPMDMVWFFLAGAAAYRVGSGGLD